MKAAFSFTVHRVFALLLSCIAAFPGVHAQSLSWAVAYSCPSGIETVLTTDHSGNVYSTGLFKGTMDLDPGTGVHSVTVPTPSGPMPLPDYNMYISRLDPAGNYVWGKHIVTSASITPRSIITEPSAGFIYICGVFNGTVDFDPGPGTAEITSSVSSKGFLLKLDLSGNFVSVKTTEGRVFPERVTADHDGNIIMSGYFMETVDLDPGAGVCSFSAPNSMNWDGFICKFDPAGSLIWARQLRTLTTSTYSSVNPSELKEDVNGNIYVGGWFNGSLDADPGALSSNLVASTHADSDAFLLKLNASGALIWAKHMGGFKMQEIHDIQTDGAGFVYATGILGINSSGDFDPGPGTVTLTGQPNGYSTFVAKYNTSGDLVWAVQSSGGSCAANSISINQYGQLFVVGDIYGTLTDPLDFDPGPGTALYPQTKGSYVWKLTDNGNFLWLGSMGGFSSKGVLDNPGNLIVAGSINSHSDLDPGSGIMSFTPSGPINPFILKMTTGVLPVKLVSFMANPDKESVLLQWTTASEANHHHFVVERSADALVFESLQQVNGNGKDGNDVRHYAARDESPLNGINYYRLTSVDYDGTTSGSDVISVVFGKKVRTAIYPNPSAGGISILFPVGTGLVSASVFDINGTLVARQDGVGERLEIDLSRFSSGIYYVETAGNNETLRHKLIRQ